MAWITTTHADSEALAAALADEISKLLRTALAERGRAALALAGGRTPFPIYRRLATAALDWSRVSLLPTDERWVDAGHAASNTRELCAAFAAAEGVGILPLVPARCDGPPDAGTALASLATLQNASFDAVLLGMGGDGHFASLFPGAAELDDGLHGEAEALVVHPQPLPPEAPFARISLGAARLLNTRRLLLAVTGETKRAVLQRAQDGKDARALPICAMLHQRQVALEVHWSP
jgi:6-phosphogluconolactonase